MCEYQFFESIIEKNYYNEKETKFEFTMTSNHPNVVTREIESGCWDIRKKISLIGKIPAEFKKAKVIAILKPGKPANEASSYRPISLLSVCHKFLEKLIYNRISPIIEENLPIEQAGFRPNRNCCDQVLALTSYIESGFQKRLKTGVVFVDLTAAYDTVWKDGLIHKLYNVIPCGKMASLLENICCLTVNSGFSLKTKAVNFDFSTMVYLKAQYCHQSYLIYIQVIYPQQIPENSSMLTTWQWLSNIIILKM
jgi:hypothetical protein